MKLAKRLLALAALMMGLALVSCQKQADEGEVGAGEAADPSQAVTGSAVSADGVEIAYVTCGQGEPALVFVHGWSCDRGYWEEQLGHFGESHKLVAVDLAGHGRSGKGRTDYTMEAFGADVATVVEKLGLEQVILIGHSMGGEVIVEAARRLSDRVIGLIGVDTLGDVELELAPEVIDGFMAPLRADFVTGTQEFLRAYMFVPQTDSTLLEFIVQDMSSAPPEIALSAMAEMFGHDVAASLAEVRAPVRLINAAKTPVDLEAGQRHAVSFEVTVMEGVGHFLMMEKPAEFNAELAATIQDLVDYEVVE